MPFVSDKRVYIGTGVVAIYDNLTAVCSVLIHIKAFVFYYKERLGAFKTFSQRSARNKIHTKRKTVYFL